MVMSEVRRVLKPTGRVAFLAWGPFEQPFFDATVAAVLRLVRGAQMPPEARVMFRFASSGSLEDVLKAAGFCNVIEHLLTVPRVCLLKNCGLISRKSAFFVIRSSRASQRTYAPSWIQRYQACCHGFRAGMS